MHGPYGMHRGSRASSTRGLYQKPCDAKHKNQTFASNSHGSKPTAWSRGKSMTLCTAITAFQHYQQFRV
eukprot:3884194-Amphidinium_carterae.1